MTMRCRQDGEVDVEGSSGAGARSERIPARQNLRVGENRFEVCAPA